VGQPFQKIKLIDWQDAEANDFVIVEEVTLRGTLERRPDLVLYVNGIAIGVIELKGSHVSVGDGIRQLRSNQQKEFNEWFFATVQIVIAGNDSEGMRYGTIGTEEKQFLTWKEDEADNSRFKLDKYLLKMCRKHRLIELIHDFVLFDGGVKKLPRVHQYFCVKAAQDFVRRREGGIIWNTQGSAQRMVLSPLTDEQHDQAHQAFDKLAGIYSLAEAIDYFLKHHRPPEFTIRATDAFKLYLDDKERDGVRDRTLTAIKSVVGQFITATDNPWLHEITASVVESFLRDLRAKNQSDKATKKTWNNYRNDLNGFLSWSATPDAGTNRPFTFENPVAAVRKFSARQVREGQDAKPHTTSPEATAHFFSVLMRWRGGVLTRYFAFLYFAGIRPDELKRLSS
jgi:Type I restriction enzyme R protein N terminus (HSDR_N)